MFMRHIAFPLFSFVFALLPCQQVLSSPVPEIIEPDPGPLSFLELIQTTLYRIIPVGFLQGVLISLLVLGCLVCLLIATFSGLAAYLRHYDTKLWEGDEELYVFDGKDEDGESTSDPVEKHLDGTDHGYNDKSPSQGQSRISRYLSRNPSMPVTKISIHASPCRASTATPVSSAPPWTPRTSVRSPVRPPRSALSKSPLSSKRPSRDQTPLLGSWRWRMRSTSSPTPKSVHWADEVQMTSVGISLSRSRATSAKGYPGPRIGTDTELCRIDGDDVDISDALALVSSTTYDSCPISQSHERRKHTFTTTCAPAQDAELSFDRTRSMKLEGDTS